MRHYLPNILFTHEKHTFPITSIPGVNKILQNNIFGDLHSVEITHQPIRSYLIGSDS